MKEFVRLQCAQLGIAFLGNGYLQLLVVVVFALAGGSLKAQSQSQSVKSWYWIRDSSFIRASPQLKARGKLLDDPRFAVQAVLAIVAEEASSRYPLPDAIGLRGEPCNFANAYYERRSRSITVCYKLAEAFLWALRKTMPDASYITVAKALRVAVAHEVGHALVDVVRLPTLGSEEDVADQYAVWHTLEGTVDSYELKVGTLTSFVAAFQEMANASGELSSARAYVGTHALALQRSANIICWMTGYARLHSLPTIGAEVVLPEDRRSRCGEEYMRIRDSWERMLNVNKSAVPR